MFCLCVCVCVFQGARGPNGSVGEKVKEKKKLSFPSCPFSGFTVIGLLGWSAARLRVRQQRETDLRNCSGKAEQLEMEAGDKRRCLSPSHALHTNAHTHRVDQLVFK